jgi:hypothetical protein
LKFTEYYINDVLSRRPYLKAEWLEKIINNPVRTEVQSDGRVRYWGYVEEIAKYLRVIIEPDGETIHNAFPDRRFKP